ncbi:MAG: hypothetical protein HYX24_04105 [Candidatus Aenigmarchaeota archaeon]|nr:hypothetical protein [Candidatus Aenigmarchaeota archaeon]
MEQVRVYAKQLEGVEELYFGGFETREERIDISPLFTERGGIRRTVVALLRDMKRLNAVGPNDRWVGIGRKEYYRSLMKSGIVEKKIPEASSHRQPYFHYRIREEALPMVNKLLAEFYADETPNFASPS